MKKLLYLALAFVLSVSLFAACGTDKEQPTITDEKPVTVNQSTENEVEKIEEAPEKTIVPQQTTSKDTTPAPAVDNETTNEDEVSVYYIITNGKTNDENISYHNEDCPLLAERETSQVSQEFVEMMGFRQCVKCTPPKYKDYID